ncbi:hypothetical protein BDF19DRAFT_70248 [Syncephalis fuscata]|nr:hypothetical protein BDF19DRAFT_70248 [Syncephalis fuscata]
MTQETLLLVQSPGVVSPTPPPESEEDVGSDRERLLKALAASTDTAAAAESHRSGLRKRKDAPNHYPFNRARRPRNSRDIMGASVFAGMDSFDEDTDATVSIADSFDIVASSNESDTTPPYSADDVALPTPLEMHEPMPTAISVEIHVSSSPSSPRRPRRSTIKSSLSTDLVDDDTTDTVLANAYMLIDDSNDVGHIDDNKNTNGHGHSLHAQQLHLQHESYGAQSIGLAGSGQMKFALSGRAPRNASFRCEFCGKKYINRAPLVTHRWEHHPSWLFAVQFGLPRRQQVQMMEAAHALLGMQQPDHLLHMIPIFILCTI